MQKPKIKQRQDAFVFEYPKAIAYSDMQNSIFWPATEIDVAKDIQDIHINMTESEQHGLLTQLRLFTKYEQFAANEYWGGRFKKMFPRPCMQTMATTFSFFEISIHARFYNALNEALNINTEEFYNSYVDDPVLKSRMDFIDGAIRDPDDLYSLAVFSMVEGVILYASFAYIKHFQSEGKNKMQNVVAGVDFSLRDENIHSMAGAWAFRTLLAEMKPSREYLEKLKAKLIQAAKIIFEHEEYVIAKTFEKGKIEGITDHQLKNFVMSRLNLTLKQLEEDLEDKDDYLPEECRLNIDPLYEVTYNPIAKWFYKDINSVNFHDFFVKTGNSYSRSWDERKFIW